VRPARRIGAVLTMIGALWIASVCAAAEESPATPYTDRRPEAVKAWRKALSIRLPDDSFVDIEIRRTPALTGPVTGSLADEYPVMRNEILAGNHDLAYGLYVHLALCSRSPRDEAEIRQELEEVARTGQARFVHHRVPIATMRDAEQITRYEQDLYRRLRRCAGLTDAQLDEALEWRAYAARHGVSWAFKDIAQLLPRERLITEEGLRVWEDVWYTGSFAGSGWLGQVHEEGARAGVEGRFDLLDGYAYYYIYYRLNRAMADEFGSAIMHRTALRVEAMLAEMELRLSPEQLAARSGRVRALLAANPACCYVD
jgi:hypothetical protein